MKTILVEYSDITNMRSEERDLRDREEAIREAITQRNQQLEDANAVLESHPDFAYVQVRMRDDMEEIERQASAATCGYGSKEFLKFADQRLILRSDGFLEFVSDFRSLHAYLVFLESFGRLAWQEYTGFPLEMLYPTGGELYEGLQSIYTIIAGRTKAAFQRLVKPRQEEILGINEAVSYQPAESKKEGVDAIAMERGASVDAYREEVGRQTGKELTRTEFAKAAGYTTLTELQRWMRNDLKYPNKTADRKFTQILRGKPHLRRT